MPSIQGVPYTPVVTVSGWLFEDWSLKKAKTKSDGTFDYWMPVLPFYPVPTVIYRDEDGEVRGFRIRFWFRDRERVVDLPSDIVYAREPAKVIAAAGGPDLSNEQGRTVVRLLTDVIAGRGSDGIEDVRVLTRARWDGDRLRVPGVERVIPSMPELAKYGQRADIDEDEAYKHWGTVIEVGRPNPRYAAVTGFPLGSVYTQRLQLGVNVLHVFGDSGFGKSEGAESAMNEFGLARGPDGPLYMTWNTSAQAIGNMVRKLGILPLFLDETGTFKGKDEDFEAIVFELAQGRSRAVANTSFGLVEGSDERWWTCVISTGEHGLVSTSDLTGMRRRVLELAAPLIEFGDDWERPAFAHDAAVDASRRAYGWPLHWLAANPDPAGFGEVRDRIMDALFDVISLKEADDRIAFHEADSIVTALSGWVTLARLVDVDVLADAKGHARALFEELRGRYEEEGTTVAQKVVAAISRSMLAAPDRWPDHDSSMIMRDRLGVTWQEFPNQVGIIDKETFRDLRFDPDAALSDLRRKHRLVLEGKRDGYKTRRPIWDGTRVSRQLLYVVRLDAEEHDGTSRDT